MDQCKIDDYITAQASPALATFHNYVLRFTFIPATVFINGMCDKLKEQADI